MKGRKIGHDICRKNIDMLQINVANSPEATKHSSILLQTCQTCLSGDGDAVRWRRTLLVHRLILLRERLLVGRVLLPAQRSLDHLEGVPSRRATSSSAALPEPLTAQVEDLDESEEDAHKAGHHHEDGEDLLFRGPGGTHGVMLMSPVPPSSLQGS